jgi:hypothetical protein
LGGQRFYAIAVAPARRGDGIVTLWRKPDGLDRLILSDLHFFDRPICLIRVI